PDARGETDRSRGRVEGGPLRRDRMFRTKRRKEDGHRSRDVETFDGSAPRDRQTSIRRGAQILIHPSPFGAQDEDDPRRKVDIKKALSPFDDGRQDRKASAAKLLHGFEAIAQR